MRLYDDYMGRGDWDDQKPNPDHKSGFTTFQPIMYVKTQPILNLTKLCLVNYAPEDINSPDEAPML